MSSIAIITRQDRANAAAARFLHTYQRNFDDRFLGNERGSTRRETHAMLVALGATPNPDDVDRAIGNDSWTKEMCSHCYSRPDRLVCIDVTGGEYGTQICEACIRKCVEAFAK